MGKARGYAYSVGGKTTCAPNETPIFDNQIPIDVRADGHVWKVAWWKSIGPTSGRVNRRRRSSITSDGLMGGFGQLCIREVPKRCPEPST